MRTRFHRLRQFVRQHGQWLPYAGAFIVLMTFVVKEELQENWQHSAESLEMAQYIDWLQESTNRSEGMLATIYNRMNDPNSHARPFAEYDPSSTAFPASEPVFLLDSLAADIDAQRILAEKLSANTEARKEWMTANQKLDALREKYEASRDIPGAPADIKRFQGTMETWRNIRMSIPPLQEEIHHNQKPLWKEAQIELESYRKRSEYASWISAMLFTLGWGLGLLGKLYGVSGSAGGE